MENLGDRIKHLRTTLGYNQKHFASIIGISSGALSSIEANDRNPPFESFISICAIANENEIDIKWLIFGKEYDQIQNTASDLSSDEVNILNKYRSMPEKVKGKAELLWEQLLEKEIDNMKYESADDQPFLKTAT